MRPIFALPVLALLAACRTDAAEPPDGCGAGHLQSFVGQALADVTLPADRTTRVVRPDQAVTLDHRPDRLNVLLDDGDRIERVYCG
ncbi:I78 family peptidase inhibitor [Jannaschia rubra]|uniref:Peptidase inhibitor I78 family protein n=1 Tax=Jannaschia rubra TaxID=282197 RepID=A0A0M6XNB4_9RHOB|nr:I78 family peptidase inhibitor [Jannaschia rubra]CTQ32636.1 Peptidase inhibitor I78 family protein [Jannaschia rubra]SFF86468.1 Peptidase inhibitor I78 family protein [Jannaschia rubra]